MKNYAYICYEQAVSEAEVELINQFWELEKGENIKFANNAQNVFKEFKSKLDKPLSIIKSKSTDTPVIMDVLSILDKSIVVFFLG